MYVNQYLIVGDLGDVDVPEFQDIGWAVGVPDHCLHRVLLLSPLEWLHLMYQHREERCILQNCGCGGVARCVHLGGHIRVGEATKDADDQIEKPGDPREARTAPVHHRGYADFRELRQHEVRRTLLLRGWVNKGKKKDRGCYAPVLLSVIRLLWALATTTRG